MEYLYRCHETAVNFKEFTILKEKMLTEANYDRLCRLTYRVEKLLKKERANAVAALELVRKDSALGFEPSMEYIGGEAGILWKLKHLDFVLQQEVPAYRRN